MAIKRLPSTGDAPRNTGVPASLVAGGAADSAGFPWAGRTFDHHETAFAGDDGAAPAELRNAVTELREAAKLFLESRDREGGGFAELALAHTRALRALSSCRVLVPLLAEAGDLGLTPEGRVVEKTQELSIVTVTGPDGRRAMPVFSSIAAMRTWNPEARPIPVPMPQAAIAAAQDETALIIVDPGTEEAEIGVRRTQLECVALAQDALPAWADEEVLDAFQQSVAGDARVLNVWLLPGDPEARLLASEVDVVCELRLGLGETEVGELISEVQQRWVLSETIAARVDSLRIRLV